MSAAIAAARRDPALSISGLARFPAARDPELRPWLGRLIAELAADRDSFAVRFVGDRTMRRWNRDYRGKDCTTDVLSFPGDRTPEGWHLGDVAISVPQAARQAEARCHSLARELRVLLLHGVLHCLGHDHDTDRGEMDAAERRLRRRFLGHA